MIEKRAIPYTAALALVAAGWMLSCATSGTGPHEMSVGAHEAAARSEERAASQHEAQFNPSAKTTTSTCPPGTFGERVCWTSMTNPTAEHLRQAERHQKAASEHRAASRALQEAEASACRDVPEADRDESPFMHLADIRSVSIDRDTPARGPPPSNVGATVVFRAVPGMTAEWLQTLVNCHLARNAALDHDVPEMPYCPLVSRGVSATVRSTGDGFAIVLRADSPASVSEIVRRVQALDTARQVGTR